MRFYGELFGWEFKRSGQPQDLSGRYYVATLRGRDVAGIGTLPEEQTLPAVWNTDIAVASVEESCSRVARAGGEVVLGPIDAPPAGRVAVVRDPAGATFCLWEPEARQGAQLVNEPSAWAMSTLQTTDPDRATAFYAELFGWQPEAFGMEGALISLCRLPGYVGGEPQQPVPRDVVAALIPLPDDGGQVSNWGVDFWIDDADAAAAKTLALGGQVFVAPHDIPGFRRTVLADPAGAALSVSQLQTGA
jgi:predicted enzyme related to lactoylglutathione lyase